MNVDPDSSAMPIKNCLLLLMSFKPSTFIVMFPSVYFPYKKLALSFCVLVILTPPLCSLLSVRRLDPSERPLQILYDYLASMGYADPVRVQQEAANSDLSCLIRFYSGECTQGPSFPVFPICCCSLGSRCRPLKTDLKASKQTVHAVGIFSSGQKVKS